MRDKMNRNRYEALYRLARINNHGQYTGEARQFVSIDDEVRASVAMDALGEKLEEHIASALYFGVSDRSLEIENKDWTHTVFSEVQSYLHPEERKDYELIRFAIRAYWHEGMKMRMMPYDCGSVESGPMMIEGDRF